MYTQHLKCSNTRRLGQIYFCTSNRSWLTVRLHSVHPMVINLVWYDLDKNRFNLRQLKLFLVLKPPIWLADLSMWPKKMANGWQQIRFLLKKSKITVIFCNISIIFFVSIVDIFCFTWLLRYVDTDNVTSPACMLKTSLLIGWKKWKPCFLNWNRRQIANYNNKDATFLCLWLFNHFLSINV